MRLPDLEAWAMFAKVAEVRSFSAAARELNVSKATVSKVIGRLEARLGAPLLQRSSRRLALSPLGEQALERATRLLAEGEAVESDILDSAAQPRGRLRVAAPMSFGISHLGPALPSLFAEYPELEIDLRLSDARTDLIAEGIDVALRIGQLEDSALRARKLCDIRAPLVASPLYIERHGAPAHPRELSQHNAIIYTNAKTPHIWRFSHPLEGVLDVSVRGNLLVNNGDVALPALISGTGVCALPDFILWEALHSGSLVHLLPDWSVKDAGLYVVTPPSIGKSARVEAFIGFITRYFRSAPWAWPSVPSLR